ncbi:hypothetical protein SAMN05444008_101103 [Cnuella takakiae]|uniref:Uncharacterized protein n=1 Tax=Cnuella takakiae TaxID=1302690 RepID=A0A1M4SEW8_9BACT|nr:hypothetical protein [Cnuella takakiae]OLY94488.1 hypothetical protein BUE76_23380 [Cnuella takakiae]SHE30773.1 hypothetical protein SAMN05444008_101103 [Cnuella takakiae]
MKAATLSRLMRMSWEIQRKRKCNRSRSLFAAWAILQNEDTTIFYLVRRFSHSHYPNKVRLADLTLFGVA